MDAARLHDHDRSPDPAYADAHRLLSELHVVARQLSLGLDPTTLAAALADELRELVDGAEPTVLVKSGGSRFVPLVGDVPTPFAESVTLDAWLGAEAIRRTRQGVTVAALPVQMGARVVAVVVLTGAAPITDAVLERCSAVVAQAGPRLASALLFDDVRRLATVDERMRLAREIHDGIAQDVASVAYLLDDIASDADPATAARLVALREHLGALVGDLRLSIFDLRAGVDESVGLARTLGDYVQRVGSQAGLVVHVSMDESAHRLPVAAEVELLRIVQEAVTNVRKHARAKNLWLTVEVDPPRARITVTDDGRGLQAKRLDSMGIQGMHERADRIGGQLSVRNRGDGSGTVVEVVIDPLQSVNGTRSRTAGTAGRRAVRGGTDQSEPIAGPGAVGTLSDETHDRGRNGPGVRGAGGKGGGGRPSNHRAAGRRPPAHSRRPAQGLRPCRRPRGRRRGGLGRLRRGRARPAVAGRARHRRQAAGRRRHRAGAAGAAERPGARHRRPHHVRGRRQALRRPGLRRLGVRRQGRTRGGGRVGRPARGRQPTGLHRPRPRRRHAAPDARARPDRSSPRGRARCSSCSSTAW